MLRLGILLQLSIVLLTPAALRATASDEPLGVADPQEPAMRPVAWELNFEYLTPRRVTVKLPNADQPRTYWYVVYTATNTSASTQHFYPIFELVTDELRRVRTDLGVPPLVFNTIKQRHQRTHPYLVSPTEAIGPLRAGTDYARESVAIWPAEEVDTPGFTIFVSGLSGEARRVPNPAYDETQPTAEAEFDAAGNLVSEPKNPRFFTVRKTLALRFLRAVSRAQRVATTPELQSQSWIMR